jgi:peroxiredoxin
MRTISTLLLSLALAAGCAASSPPPASPASTTASSAPADNLLAEPSLAVTADMGSPHVGDAAPDFTLVDQDGKTIHLSDLRGSVVMLAFVTSWCPFSEAEQPHLAALARDYAGKNVRVIAIDMKEGDADYSKYVGRVSMPFSVLRDRDGAVAASYTPVRAQPEVKDRSTVVVTSNLVIDQQGTVQFFTMVDTVHFDAKLVHARRKIDTLLARGAAGG